jgi:hypothetical protein
MVCQGFCMATYVLSESNVLALKADESISEEAYSQ